MLKPNLYFFVFVPALAACDLPSFQRGGSYPMDFVDQHPGTLCLEAPLSGCFETSSRLRVRFKNELGDAFKLSRVRYVLDGDPVLDNADPSMLERGTFIGSINDLESGEHELKVVATMQGNGYGVFSYLRGYRFEARKTLRFRVREPNDANPSRVLTIVTSERGGATTPLEERPQMRFELEPARPTPSAAPEAAPAAAPEEAAPEVAPPSSN